MALVPKREDRLLERLTLAEERAALATERALGAEAVARAVAAREAEKKPRASRDGALRDAAQALADAQRRLADATAERRRLRDEVVDARDSEREWRLKYEGSRGQPAALLAEAEKARRDAADARAATRLALGSADEAKADAAAERRRAERWEREAAAVRSTVERCRTAEAQADEAAAALRAAAHDHAAALAAARARADALEACIADDDAASVDGASHEALVHAASGDLDDVSSQTSVVVLDGGDAFVSLTARLRQSEDVAHALRAEVAALQARPPPSPAYTSVEDTLRERVRAAEADRDRIQGRLRDAVAAPASPVYTSAEATLRDRLAAAEADRGRLSDDQGALQRERDALRAAATADRAALEAELATQKSAAEVARRDAARRGEGETALRRENQQLRADAEMLTPRTGKAILAARLEKATETETELRAEVASRTPRATKVKLLAELNGVSSERDKLRAAADEHQKAAQRFRDEMDLVRREAKELRERAAKGDAAAAAAEALRGRLAEAEVSLLNTRDKRAAGDALRSAAENARREAASLLLKIDGVEAARIVVDAKAATAEWTQREAEKQRDDAVAEAQRWQDCAEDAEARCAASEEVAGKSAAAAAEAISKARYAAKDLEHTRNELAAVAQVAASRNELENELAAKNAELEEAGRLAGEVERLRREVQAAKSEASTALKEELAAARCAVEKKDSELAQLRANHITRLREAEEQLAAQTKLAAEKCADAIYARAEAQAAQQRPSPGALKRTEGRCEALQRDLEVAQNDWVAERDRLRDARDAQRDRYEELKQRIDEGDEAQAIALEHAERRADAASGELEEKDSKLGEALAKVRKMTEKAGTHEARDERHASALEDVSRQLVVAHEKLRRAEAQTALAAESSDISTSTTALPDPLNDIYKQVRKHERRWQAERARADAATEELEKLRSAHGKMSVDFDAARRRNRSPAPAIASSPDKALDVASPTIRRTRSPPPAIAFSLDNEPASPISPSRRPLQPHAPAASRFA